MNEKNKDNISVDKVGLDLDTTEGAMRDHVSDLEREMGRRRREMPRNVGVGMVADAERLSRTAKKLERATRTLHTLNNLNLREHVECEKKDNLLVCEGDPTSDYLES